MRIKPRRVVGLLTVAVLLAVTGCASKASHRAARMGDPLNASTTFPPAVPGHDRADVSVCHALIRASDVPSTIADFPATPNSCAGEFPGYDVETFQATSVSADFGESVEVMINATAAQTEMDAFGALSGLVRPLVSNVPFRDLATEVRYGHTQGAPMGLGLIYVYGIVMRQGCTLVSLSISAPQPITVATLRELAKVALSRIAAAGVRPYVEPSEAPSGPII